MNKKAITVLKPRFIILTPFIAWLLFSIWCIYMVALPPFRNISEAQQAKSLPNTSEFVYMVNSAIVTLWGFGDMMYKRYHQTQVSVEQKSILTFLFGLFVMSINRYLEFGNFLFYAGIVLVDILPITATIVLLQGKSFGLLRLYHKDIQIR